MSNDLDPFLKTLFVEADRPLEEGAFMREVLAGLQRIQRRRTLRRIVLAVAAVVAVVVVMPMVLEQTASMVNLVMGWMDGAPSPVYWTVSTFIGIWVILRTGHLRRR